jgi:hypothetical protein
VTSTPYEIEPGRVPIGELGSYTTIGRMDGWGIRADADGTVEVRSPFGGLRFDLLPEADRDRRQALAACQALLRRDRDIYDEAQKTWSGDTRTFDDRLKAAEARRAGAALWLFRRDLRRHSHACPPEGVAAGWTFHPRCKVYNSDGHETDLTVGSRTGKELHVALGMHVLEGGVFRRQGWVDVQVFHDGGAVRTSGSFSEGRSELDRALHAEMVGLACRLAEEQQEAAVAREQAKLDHLRSRLALVRP